MHSPRKFDLAEASISVTTVSPASITVTIRGELDVDAAGQAQSVLSTLLPDRGDLVVDLAGVTFLGSSGIRALVQVHNECEQRGLRFRVRNPAPPARRVLEICGLTTAFGIPDAAPPAARQRTALNGLP